MLKTQKKQTGGRKNGKDTRNRSRNNAFPGRALSLSLKPEVCEIEVTKACNLKCIHCYARAGLASPQELSNDEITELLDCNKTIKHVILTGGEPFIRKDLMELIELIRIRDIDISINTNGLLLTQAKVERLADLEVSSIQISLDGLEQAHDRIRNLKGCFKKTVKAIRLCVDVGMDVEVSTVLTKLNKDELLEILELCKKLGVKKFSVDLFIPTGRAIDNELEVPLGEYVRIIRQITDVTKLKAQEHIRPKCGVGFKKVVINEQGDILPCVAMPNLVAGNIRKDNLTEVFNQSNIFKEIRAVEEIEECSKCSSRMICCGGCRARAFALFGRILAPDPVHCALFNKAE